MIKPLIVAGAVGVSRLGPLDDVSLYLYGVPAQVILMSLLGAGLSFAWNPDESKPPPKKKMYIAIACITLLTPALVAAVPGMFGFGEWYSPKLEGSLALILATVARFIAPIFLKLLPEIARKWFGVGEYNKNKKADNEPSENL